MCSTSCNIIDSKFDYFTPNDASHTVLHNFSIFYSMHFKGIPPAELQLRNYYPLRPGVCKCWVPFQFFYFAELDIKLNTAFSYCPCVYVHQKPFVPKQNFHVIQPCTIQSHRQRGSLELKLGIVFQRHTQMPQKQNYTNM